jgi:5-methylcytosine-specific restriction endonuclease McrA
MIPVVEKYNEGYSTLYVDECFRWAMPRGSRPDLTRHHIVPQCRKGGGGWVIVMLTKAKHKEIHKKWNMYKLRLGEVVERIRYYRSQPLPVNKNTFRSKVIYCGIKWNRLKSYMKMRHKYTLLGVPVFKQWIILMDMLNMLIEDIFTMERWLCCQRLAGPI